VVTEPVILNQPANSHSRDRRIMKSSSVTVQSQVIEIEEIFLMHLSYLCTNLVLVLADIIIIIIIILFKKSLNRVVTS
jgi:hypothetical protein